jgi:uncharacterized membrane protein (UPF0182 family)
MNNFRVIEPERWDRRGRPGFLGLVIVAALILIGAPILASYVIEYQWWGEMHQVPTWLDVMLYTLSPVAAGTLLTFVVLLIAHWRGMTFAGMKLGDHSRYAKLSAAVLFFISLILASGAIDTWTVVRYVGGWNLPLEATAWHDSVFGRPLGFYLFDLPFYGLLRDFVLALAVAAGVVYWLTARGWQMRDKIDEIRDRGRLDLRMLRLGGDLESHFLRMAAAVFLLMMAFSFFLGRYEMVWNDHSFMVGIDYVDLKIGLPLQWLAIAASVLAAGFIAMGRWSMAAWMALALILKVGGPVVVRAVYVRPNEISLERPYIQQHIEATRSAFGLDQRVTEKEVAAKLDGRFDPAKNQALLQNVRLWDWHAFHDTVTQIQALRPYYTFADTDVDRYVIDGQLRQVLLTPRELDIRQLPAAQSRWINPHFIYTHGYGLVMAEANRITADGLPLLFIQDAPAVVKTSSLKLTRPEIYYGEVTHEPIFVHTAQPEFNYPSGADNVFASYEGTGGFPVSSLPMRIAAAVSEGDPNILLTGYLTPDSRMMIRRNVLDRLRTLAAFITWEHDPYLVVTESGRLVWTVDGYTTSNSHPYSRSVELNDVGSVNYMRNAVKATVDAYDGEVRIYIFDPADPIIRAYQHLFPRLLLPFSEMPADLKAHARYPETFFNVQAEVYRTYHMRDPQAFYNKEDLWDISRTVQGQGTDAHPNPVAPTYIVANLPGEDRAEFMLITSFTPRNKDNMIGLMVARCDGAHLGELVVLQLSKQELIFGTMQIGARINQDQTISKDLTLWNQQGSQVLRGQTLVLPVGNTFLYVEPLYIQASEARMPQLKKVVVAIGNTLIYRDTYEQALGDLDALMQGGLPEAVKQPVTAVGGGVTPVPPAQDHLRESVRNHLAKARELLSQGKWAEAGKELDAIEAEVRK